MKNNKSASKQKISDLGEFGLIQRLSQSFNRNLPQGVIGIGDDCAVIPWSSKYYLLVTTDMLTQDVHFYRNKISPEDLGYKSLACSLSDIAAMGGKPKSAYLSLGLPQNTPLDWMDRFISGVKKLSVQENVNILGGDTIQSPSAIIINVVVLGIVQKSHIKLRSMAKPGDLIFVTDVLGDSGGGLKILKEGKSPNRNGVYLIKRHHRPRPHLVEGQWLSKQKGVHAMIDLSDGVDSDLRRIAEMSSCGAKIYMEYIPVSVQLRKVSDQYQWNPLELALTAGEDYCLLVTIDPEKYPEILKNFEKHFKRPLSYIGLVTEKGTQVEYYKFGKVIELGNKGYNHFKKSET